MIFTKELRIDIAQIGVNETIHLHEGDVNGTEFYISLYKNGEPLSLALYNVKYDASIDGYLAEQDANVSLIQGNEIHVPITERMTAKNGILRIDIKLMKNHDVAFIQTVEAFVQRRVINDEVVIDVSGTTIGAKLQELDTKIAQALESLDDKADISDIPTKVSDLDNDAHYLTSHQDISGKEDKSNKRQTINPAEAQNIGAIYPSVKAVVDYVANNHQDISGKVDKTQTIAGLALSGNIRSATLAEAMAGNINPVGVVPGTTTGYGAQFGRSSAGKPVMHMLSKDWEELALASDMSGKQDKQTSVPTVGITEERGQWVVDTTDSVFRGLSIGQLFKAEIGEVYHTYQKTSESAYLKISDILHDGDIPSNVSAFNNDAGYLTAHQGISGKEDKSNKVTEIDDNATNTQYPSALAVKKAIDAANPYVFVTEIPQNADHSKKYVLPDGYIWEWREGTPGVPHNANTGIINKRPPTNDNYETALLNQSGTLVSELIPFDASWKYSSDGSYGHLADIQISGINKLVPAYNSSIIIYYYRRNNGNSLGAVLSAQMHTLNNTPNTDDITLPVQFSLMDQDIYFSGVDTSNPGATIGYVRVMIGISTAGNITENDVKDIVINVPFYDTPGTSAGWTNTGQKHPDYISDSVFDVDTDQVLYVVGDSIAYGYGGSGVRIDSWVKYAIEHNGYDAENSLNLSESGLGFCTTSARSHTINDIVGGNSFSGADAVVVALGVNDWKNANATLTQLWSGMQYCFNKIRTDNPYCKIYYLLPFNVSFSGAYASFYGLGFKGDSDTSKCYGHTLREFINLIKAKLSEPTFKTFDIHVIDMVECAAINRNNITTALFDNLHPSAATQEVLGKEIARFIAQDRSVKDNSNYLTLDTLPIYNGGVQ